jgi:glycosyltransferase involved in cell wall biosynthesis
LHVLILTSERYTPPEEPLAGVFQRDQALALHRAGAQVGVVAPLPRSLRFVSQGRSLRRGAERAEEDGICVYRAQAWSRLPGRVPYAAALQYRRDGRELFRQYVRERGMPDVVHAHNLLYAGWFAGELRETHGTPVAVTEHNSVHLTGDVHAWQAPMVRAAVARADACLAVSPALANALARFSGGRPWEWVPNLLDSTFERALPPAPRREGTETTFLCVAAMTPEKNHAMLLEAFAQRFGGRGDIKLRLAGDGPLRGGLEQRAARLGISEQIAFVGRLTRSEVAREMLACDALVLSSDVETFGVVLAEALACGRPVIATRCGGPDAVVGPEDGILVPPGDTDAFGEAMLRMTRSAREYAPEELRRRCLSRFGETAVVGQLLRVYSRILAERRP